jgi:hypothetical protein
MGIKSSRFFKTTLAVVATFVLLFSTQLSCFAVVIKDSYKYTDNYEIMEVSPNAFSTWAPKGQLEIPAEATGIKSNAFKNKTVLFSLYPKVDVSKITRVVIPENVKYIEANAFTSDCKALKEVVIQNAKSRVNVASNAFPSGVAIYYTIEETTKPPETTSPPVVVPDTKPPVTQAPPVTTTPSTTAPHTTQKPKDNKKPNTTAGQPTTKISATNKVLEDLAEPTVKVTDPKVPLADLQNNGYPEELDAWNAAVNASVQKGEGTSANNKQGKNQTSKVVSYAVGASVSVAAFAGIIFTYFRFKK